MKNLDSIVVKGNKPQTVECKQHEHNWALTRVVKRPKYRIGN